MCTEIKVDTALQLAFLGQGQSCIDALLDVEDAHLEALIRSLVFLLLLFRFIAIFLLFAVGGGSFGSLLNNWSIGEATTGLLDEESTDKCRDFFWNCVVLDVFGHYFLELGSKLNGSRNALDVEPLVVIDMLDQVGINTVLGKQSQMLKKLVKFSNKKHGQVSK